MTCEQTQHLIDDMLASELAASDWSTLRAHAQTCGKCRAAYNHAVMAERLLDGGPAGLGTPSQRELARIGEAVLAEVAGPAKVSLGVRLASWFRAPSHWVPAAAAAAILVGLVPLVAHRPGEPELVARGGAQGDKAAVRAFCIASDGTVRTGQAVKCGQSEQLKFTLSNHGYTQLFLVGVDADYALKWYAPHAPEGASVSIAEGVDEPLGSAIRVGVNHDPGPVRVFAVFSKEPITAKEVESTVAEWKRQSVAPSTQDKLPLAKSGVAQQALSIEVTP